MLKKITIGLVSAAFLVSVAFVALVVQSGFPYKYMDLNDSGLVSLREAIRTLDMGIRDVTVGGEKCVEVFALKDAQTIKQICSEA